MDYLVGDDEKTAIYIGRNCLFGVGDYWCIRTWIADYAFCPFKFLVIL